MTRGNIKILCRIGIIWCLINLLYLILEFLWGIVSMPNPGISYFKRVIIIISFIIVVYSILSEIRFLSGKIPDNKNPINAKKRRIIIITIYIIALIVFSYCILPQLYFYFKRLNWLFITDLLIGIWRCVHYLTVATCLIHSIIVL